MEKLTVRVPGTFDQLKHGDALLRQASDRHGPGWEIMSVDMSAGQAHLVRGSRLTQVSTDGTRTMTVSLQSGVRPSDGDKIAQRLAEQYPGFHMTVFEPHLGRARLGRLSDDEVRCRGAVAVALGVKPWDVQVAQRADGGFDLVLPRSYVPSRHEAKLDEVATAVVGRDGWYCAVDARALTASLIPSDPPTFPAVVPYPLGIGTADETPFARALPAPGHDQGPVVSIRWNSSAWTLLGGTPGSGKSVAIACIIANAVSNGMALAVVDQQAKAVDYEWCRDLCMPGGWGCDSLQHSATTLGLVYELGQRRAEELRASGHKNWLDMPSRFQPVLVIVDEMSALTVPEPVPKGLPKGSPLVEEIAQINLAKATIASYVRKIVAELRFVGIRALISTQATNANTGVPPSLRTLMGNFILQGTKPSRAARGQIFTDETAVPHVPRSVADDERAGRGAGVCQLEGQKPAVIKGFFADERTMRRAVDATGPRTCTDPAPTRAQIARFFPGEDDLGEQEHSGQDVERGPSGKPASLIAAEMGDDLSWRQGSSAFERANAARHAAGGGDRTRRQREQDREEAAWAARSGPVETRKTPPPMPS